MEPIRVFLVEDDPDWLKLADKLIGAQPDMTVVGQAASRDEAIRSISELAVDVIVLDIQLSHNNLDGIKLATEIGQIKRVKTIMLTSISEENVIRDSFTAGAVNFIPKERFKEIPQAIRATYTNTSPIEVLLPEYSRLKREEQLSVLTPAEREVFDLIEQGYTQNKIGDRLFKSTFTIKKQVAQILKKLRVGSSKEAQLKVRNNGIQ
ncbi:response regulator [Paenibacillus sp. GCM10027627]|uniref:response regulator transcription factor n=1 Tax=unclassified Paenibacillus TaxID=185978 RepID=UPI00363A5F1C